MKTIRQKAKAYDKALEIAKKVHKYSSDVAEIKRMEEIFPELHESEGEMIRKEIIQSIKDNMVVIHKDKCIAWLEKVGEDNKFLKSIKVGDILTKSPDGILINLGQSDRVLEHHDKFKASDWYVSKVDGKIHNIYYSDDKVEPTFKVGDWIIRYTEWFEHNVYLITDICDYYGCTDKKGARITLTANDVHKNFRLWNILDAEEGEILANDNVICVYKERVSEHLIKVTINYSIKEDVETHYDTIGDSDLHPATKSQRDFFISKILQK